MLKGLGYRHIEDKQDRYFTGNDPQQCSVFGCCKPLSLIEQLAGKVCTAHMTTPGIDPVRIIKL